MNTEILKRLASASFAVAALSLGHSMVAQTTGTYNPTTRAQAPAAAVPARPTITLHGVGDAGVVTSADQEPTTTSALMSAARDIRQALLQDADTARAPVWISPLNGRITLAGTVANDALKSKIEGIANHVAHDSVVVSLLKAQSQ